MCHKGRNLQVFSSPKPLSCLLAFSQFPSPEAVLEGARYMVALQIAREPLVRQVLRQTFQERAKINISPTKKGKKVRKGALTQWVNLGKHLNHIQMLIFASEHFSHVSGKSE